MPIQPTVLHPENNPDVNLHPETDAGQVTDFLNKTYPVNSIFMSVDSTSPASLFGGTWTRIQDGFLRSAGHNGVSAGTTGGGSVTILRDNLPINTTWSATNTQESPVNITGGVSQPSGNLVLNNGSSAYAPLSELRYKLLTPGENYHLQQPLEIMPAYIAVYMWKRVA